MDEQVNDTSLMHLRQQIKKIMIPLLIKIFELKLAAQQNKNFPSRLQKQPLESTEKIRDQLLSMQENLKLLQLWCQSCQNQINRALKETESSSDPCLPPISSDSKSYPAVEKSFSEAVFSQASRFKKEPASPPPQKITLKQKVKSIFFSKKERS